MADVLNITDTSWSGPALDYMITRAVVDVDTIVKGCANVVDGIRKQVTIPRVEVSGLIQHYAATPVSNGNITVDGRVLDPQKFEMYQEFNPADFEQHFFAEQFEQDRLIDRTLPPTAENFIMLQYMKRLNEYLKPRSGIRELCSTRPGKILIPCRRDTLTLRCKRMQTICSMALFTRL
jgi:hypothetical protein